MNIEFDTFSPFLGSKGIISAPIEGNTRRLYEKTRQTCKEECVYSRKCNSRVEQRGNRVKVQGGKKYIATAKCTIYMDGVNV